MTEITPNQLKAIEKAIGHDTKVAIVVDDLLPHGTCLSVSTRLKDGTELRHRCRIQNGVPFEHVAWTVVCNLSESILDKYITAADTRERPLNRKTAWRV